jgi:hypothetical protein
MQVLKVSVYSVLEQQTVVTLLMLKNFVYSLSDEELDRDFFVTF